MNIFSRNKTSAAYEAAITAMDHLTDLENQARTFGNDREMRHRIMDQRDSHKAAVAAVKNPSEIAKLRAAWANR